jgi:hypothetical protein
MHDDPADDGKMWEDAIALAMTVARDWLLGQERDGPAVVWWPRESLLGLSPRLPPAAATGEAQDAEADTARQGRQALRDSSPPALTGNDPALAAPRPGLASSETVSGPTVRSAAV